MEEVLVTWVGMDQGPERLLARLGEAMDFAVGCCVIKWGDVLQARASWSAHPSEAPELERAERPLESGRLRP